MGKAERVRLQEQYALLEWAAVQARALGSKWHAKTGMVMLESHANKLVYGIHLTYLYRQRQFIMRAVIRFPCTVEHFEMKWHEHVTTMKQKLLLEAKHHDEREEAREAEERESAEHGRPGTEGDQKDSGSAPTGMASEPLA